MTIIVRCPSKSGVKIAAIKMAFDELGITDYEIKGLPVELQSREDLMVNAQPIGYSQTLLYASNRLGAMWGQYHPENSRGYDISIESGAIKLNPSGELIPDEVEADCRPLDVAVVVIHDFSHPAYIGHSVGVPFPEGTLEEAIRRGVKDTTAGDVIAEKFPDVPSGSWQEHFFPALSREKQIADAVKAGIIALREQA